MADYYSLCIIGVMDRLWFHQIVVFSEPTASVNPKLVETPLSISESLSCPSVVLSLSALPDEETSTDETPSPEKQVSSDSISVPLQGDSNNEEENKDRPKRMNVWGNRIRSHSSSPLTSNRHGKIRKSASRRLQKSMSYRTLGELELEEVKGFMDLGFIFKKENMSPRMMSIVPGLRILGMHQNKQNATKTVGDSDIEKKEEKTDIMRPYLSEAWLIKRPDSQLLNLKIPRLCSAADMKKHLQFWAKTVSSEIHQE